MLFCLWYFVIIILLFFHFIGQARKCIKPSLHRLVWTKFKFNKQNIKNPYWNLRVERACGKRHRFEPWPTSLLSNQILLFQLYKNKINLMDYTLQRLHVCLWSRLVYKLNWMHNLVQHYRNKYKIKMYIYIKQINKKLTK